jgi:hypothetical protein
VLDLSQQMRCGLGRYKGVGWHNFGERGRRDETRRSKFGGPILEKIQQRLALIFNIKPQYETLSGKHAAKIGQLQLC